MFLGKNIYDNYPLLFDLSFVSYLHFHHLLEDPALLVGVAPVDEVAPSHQDEHKQNNNWDKKSNESCAIFSTLCFSTTTGIIIATILAII